jgi:hypothetical protein
MSATLKRRLARLESRAVPSASRPEVWLCYRDQAGALRKHITGEEVPTEAERHAQGLAAVEVREMPLDEFRAICADLEERF